ncbi:MAG TPA: PPOX class F420-dependent oxidoreductase [Ktedonobacterales bacterium]
MSVFTPAEIAYLQGQRIGHLATVNARGEPHVVPVRYRYNPALDAVELGGRGMGTSKKYRDAASSPAVAFVVDDRGPSGAPRGIEVRGVAEALDSGGDAIWPDADPQFLRIRPRRIAAWGIESDPYAPRGRDV